jgi:hypothetical protein
LKAFGPYAIVLFLFFSFKTLVKLFFLFGERVGDLFFVELELDLELPLPDFCAYSFSSYFGTMVKLRDPSVPVASNLIPFLFLFLSLTLCFGDGAGTTPRFRQYYINKPSFYSSEYSSTKFLICCHFD